jgi:hypothetical protein
MTKSSRLAPNQFGAGLTLDATRLDQDLVALSNRYNAPLPCDIARRWVESHLVAGFLPNTFPVNPYVAAFPTGMGAQQVVQALPWMGAYNPAPVGTAADDTTAAGEAPPPAASAITNSYRHKGTKQTGIDPAEGVTDIQTWEVSWTQTGPCLLDSITMTLATDSFYANDFLFQSGIKSGEPLDDIVVQVLVDSVLDSSNRIAALAPVLVRNFKASEFWISLPSLSGVVDTMQPPVIDGTVPAGLCIQLFPRQPIPENARVRVALSIPLDDSMLDVSPIGLTSFGQHPWQTFVFSSHITLLQPAEAV